MKIVSGGQTGVDRAALDAAIELKIPHGGWCPKGRRAELESVIPEKYILKETVSMEFEERTKLNINDSDGTLILVLNTSIKVTDGTLLTIKTAQEMSKPCLIMDISKECDIERILEWVNENNIEILNVAGPRESQAPGIYLSSFILLQEIFSSLLNKPQAIIEDQRIDSSTNYLSRINRK